jgi:hypothetical protein
MNLEQDSFRKILPRFVGGQYLRQNHAQKIAYKACIAQIELMPALPNSLRYELRITHWCMVETEDYLQLQFRNWKKSSYCFDSYIATITDFKNVTYMNDTEQLAVRIEVPATQELISLFEFGHPSCIDFLSIPGMEQLARRFKKLPPP